MPTYETVTVTVLAENVPLLLDRAAELARPAEEVSSEAAAERGERRFSKAAVMRAYRGGKSDYWRPFLAALAQQSLDSDQDGWVRWEDLHTTVGLTASEAAGMLGAAERRCKGELPYDKVWEGGERWFTMPDHVAKTVLELADQA